MMFPNFEPVSVEGSFCLHSFSWKQAINGFELFPTFIFCLDRHVQVKVFLYGVFYKDIINFFQLQHSEEIFFLRLNKLPLLS